LHGFFGARCLQGDDPQQLRGERVRRLTRQDPAVHRLGLGDPALEMQPLGLL
jgi:hypothetical protein